jgi:hypothetical protein
LYQELRSKEDMTVEEKHKNLMMEEMKDSVMPEMDDHLSFYNK